MAIEQVQNLPQQYVTDLGVDYGSDLDFGPVAGAF